MGRLSRGCRRCRERRVRCDEGRPSCRRCINRNEVCEGYRDTASLIFRHETDKVIENAQTSHASSSPSSQVSSGASARMRSRSVDASSTSGRRSLLAAQASVDASALAPHEAKGVNTSNTHRWLKVPPPKQMQRPVEEQAVDIFMDKYVLYPCNQTSSPGFLEHLPSMFQEVNNMSGRHALRWSVRAAAYADISKDWLNLLNDAEPYVRLEGMTHEINETCKRARNLLEGIHAGGIPRSTVVHMIQELHSLDQTAVSWRQTPHRSFATVSISDRPDLAAAAEGTTDKIQLHSDIWMAYEWNYHRAARVIFLQQLLTCSRAALEAPDLDDVEEQVLTETVAECISTVRWLADEVLATVPQLFGDVDHMGRPHDCTNGPPRCRGIGGYLLLWPIKIIKGQACATTPEQKERGDKSMI
ncbi:hypothetical protein SBRCBS47491_004702 [Sporothrix bragantina]|uniref:Zn(2)-C6 fungal-type domain-containing protein n=1 Tax=Sporothrix bragantina TaxID=671064 RepID=A0ABP0BSB2_9PEZI